MIIVDQITISEPLLMHRASSRYLSRRRRAGHLAPRDTVSRDGVFSRTRAIDGDGKDSLSSQHRPHLSHQLLRSLRDAAAVDRRLLPGQLHDRDDTMIYSDNELGQGNNELGQGRQDTVRHDKRSKSGGVRGPRQLDNYVTLDSHGDFELFWDVDSVTETIQFRLVANVHKDDLLAFGFSDYGEPHNADFCVMWTDLHGRHRFQVNHCTVSSATLDRLLFCMSGICGDVIATTERRTWTWTCDASLQGKDREVKR